VEQKRTLKNLVIAIGAGEEGENSEKQKNFLQLPLKSTGNKCTPLLERGGEVWQYWEDTSWGSKWSKKSYPYIWLSRI